MEPNLNLKAAASIVGCSKAHLLNVIHNRVKNVPPLPCARIGRRILIRRESLERWLAAVEAPTAPAPTAVAPTAGETPTTPLA